jgi:hypothetical protein
MRPALIVALIAVAVPAGASLAGCGDDKSVSSGDRAALDSFADGVRSWQREGSQPWNRAFKQGGTALADAAPKAEAALTKSTRQIKAAANQLSEPEVREPLQRLAKTCAAKTSAIKQIDSNTGSLSAINAGLSQLQADGVATQKAWEAWVAAAKKKWNANPLAGLKVC